MGLNIRIHDINVPASFELFYKTGNTPGNMTVIENGYTQFGGTYPSSNSRNYNNDPIVFTGATFNTQYWFKIQYTGVTGQENSVGYIIENIKTHQPVGHIYYALHCCDFSGGTAEFYTGCTFSGGTVVYGQSLDPTSTPPATPEATPNPTASPTPTGTAGTTPNPTNTQTPTPTLATAPSCGLTSGELPWISYYNTNPAGTVVNNSGVTLYVWLGAAAPAGSGDTFSSNSPYSLLTVGAAGGGGYSYSSSYVTLSNGQSWPYNITRTSGTDTSFDVNLYWSTSPTGTKYPFSCLPPTATPTETIPGATPNPTPTPTLSQTPGTTPIPTPTPTDEIQYTYLAACSGGTILGWIQGSYQASLGVTIGGTCYVTTYTSTAPSIGSLITGTQTWGSCCPTPNPTASLSLVAVGIYTGATFGSSTAACSDTNYPNGTLYLPHGETLSNTDILYIDQTLFTQFTGSDQYYRLYYNGNFYAATISSMGYVSNLISCSSIPGPTPNPTNTPTPSVTSEVVAGNGCIYITESSTYSLQDGCGGYQRTENTVYFTLQDGNGNNITATEIISVSIDGTYSDELGNSSTSVGTQINVGTSSGTSSYTPSSYEIGPYSGQCIPVSTTLDYNSITIIGSNGGTYTVCAT